MCLSGGYITRALREMHPKWGYKNLLKGKHKAGASVARGPEAGGSQDHSS